MFIGLFNHGAALLDRVHAFTQTHGVSHKPDGAGERLKLFSLRQTQATPPAASSHPFNVSDSSKAKRVRFDQRPVEIPSKSVRFVEPEKAKALDLAKAGIDRTYLDSDRFLKISTLPSRDHLATSIDFANETYAKLQDGKTFNRESAGAIEKSFDEIKATLIDHVVWNLQAELDKPGMSIEEKKVIRQEISYSYGVVSEVDKLKAIMVKGTS